MLAHRLDDCVLDSLLLELIEETDDEKRIHLDDDDDAFFDELRRRNLQQRAVVKDGSENDMVCWGAGSYERKQVRERMR